MFSFECRTFYLNLSVTEGQFSREREEGSSVGG